MKRIRCPKCDTAISFDDRLYEPGRILVFGCPECQKQFKIRIPRTNAEKEEERPTFGILTVLENNFQLKTDIPLYEGDNIIGRFVKGTKANAAFKTVDPSIDTTHCIVNVKPLKDGRTTITLRDAPSGTGTFLQGEILNDRERDTIENGSIINIGAATIILKLQTDDEA